MKYRRGSIVEVQCYEGDRIFTIHITKILKYRIVGKLLSTFITCDFLPKNIKKILSY